VGGEKTGGTAKTVGEEKGKERRGWGGQGLKGTGKAPCYRKRKKEGRRITNALGSNLEKKKKDRM